MNKKLFALVGVVALGIGGVSAVALQSHAQQAPVPSATVAAEPSSGASQVAAPADTDNIQNDSGSVDLPDAVVSQGAPSGQSATGQTSVKPGDTQEHSEGTSADVNEPEYGN